MIITLVFIQSKYIRALVLVVLKSYIAIFSTTKIQIDSYIGGAKAK